MLRISVHKAKILRANLRIYTLAVVFDSIKRRGRIPVVAS